MSDDTNATLFLLNHHDRDGNVTAVNRLLLSGVLILRSDSCSNRITDSGDLLASSHHCSTFSVLF